MQKLKINGRDINRGKKRINITLSLREFEDLLTVAEEQGLEFTSIAGSWVKQRARDECAKLLKKGYVPIAARGDDLFSKKKVK